MGPNTRYDCQVGEKKIHFLRLEGHNSQINYAHGRLLAKESVQGSLKEIHGSMEKDLKTGSLLSRELKKSIVECYSTRIQNSVSREFIDGTGSFYQGLQDALGSRNPFSRKDVLTSATAIELSIAAEGLMRRLEEDKIGTIAEMATVCGIRLSLNQIDDLLRELQFIGKMKLGCLGFVSPSGETRESSLVHGRNFDANLVESWNKAPTVFLIHEPGYYRYVAAASAGVIFPGGISGLNEMGISASLHEMSTTHYKTSHSGRSGEIAPFLQQRILREAANLDEAIALIKRTKHFGAWTILLADSKNDDVASIEISGDRVQVARRSQNSPMGQSNHFLGDQMWNQFFTYSFGKNLESLSRLRVVERALHEDRGGIDIDWAIDHLAGHEDAFEGLRAFGRTAVKAYNVMSTIMIPNRSQIWLSIGDRMPAAHSYFAGFQINFRSMSFEPLEERRTQQYSDIPNWEESLSVYVQARLAYEAGNKNESYRLLRQAQQLALEDHIDETTYRYVVARLLLEMGFPELALSHFDALWSQRDTLHGHKRALIGLYSARAALELPKEKMKQRKQKSREQLSYAKDIFTKMERSARHFDLRAKLSQISKIQNGSKTEMPAIDFVTVE